MKRSGFKRAAPPRPPKQAHDYEAPKREPRGQMLRVDDGRARLTVAVPKVNPVRHEGYRRLVARLPCMSCGVDGYSNACHGDMGKGMAIKSDDRTCWPGCVDRPGVVGCHTQFGASGSMPRAERRRLEAEFAQRTRERIRELGLWPKDLEWNE